MEYHLKPILRRKFLETGIAGGAIIAFLPFWKLFSAPSSESSLESDCSLSRDSLERLHEIASRYGSEFAEVYVKWKKETDCAKTKSRLRRTGHGSV